MRYKHLHIAIIACIVFATSAFADTTQSRDGEGQKIQGAAYGAIRSASIGTKGFKCFSTTSRMAWEVNVTATAGTDAATLAYKYFINGDETVTYPMAKAFFQWQNAPTSKSPNVTKACVRKYSSATNGTANGMLQ